MELTNLKAHTKVLSSCLSLFIKNLSHSDKVKKRQNSFVVLQLVLFPEYRPLVFSCFFSGHINVTGVRKWPHLSLAFQKLADHLRLKGSIFEKIKIDMISSKWPHNEKHLLKKTNLFDVLHAAHMEESVKGTQYDRERFPGLYIRTQFGTIIWFTTPNIIAVNSKCEQDLLNLKVLIENIIKNVSLLQ